MQEDKIGNSRMVQNGKKTRLATHFRTAVCPEGPADSIVWVYQTASLGDSGGYS